MIADNVMTIDETNPGNNVAPYIGKKIRSRGITFVMTKMAHNQYVKVNMSDVTMLARDTFLLNLSQRKKDNPGIKPTNQDVPAPIPAKTETPLPPLKEAKIGQQGPIEQPSAATQ